MVGSAVRLPTKPKDEPNKLPGEEGYDQGGEKVVITAEQLLTEGRMVYSRALDAQGNIHPKHVTIGRWFDKRWVLTASVGIPWKASACERRRKLGARRVTSSTTNAWRGKIQVPCPLSGVMYNELMPEVDIQNKEAQSAYAIHVKVNKLWKTIFVMLLNQVIHTTYCIYMYKRMVLKHKDTIADLKVLGKTPQKNIRLQLVAELCANERARYAQST
eukprot:4182871-Pyramimonas_sp.AAC.1